MELKVEFPYGGGTFSFFASDIPTWLSWVIVILIAIGLAAYWHLFTF